MTGAEIDKNNCLVINQDQFRHYRLHPLWLRERLTEPEFLDNNNSFTDNEWQELYELSEGTFVEESEQLKKSAAGAGLTDND